MKNRLYWSSIEYKYGKEHTDYKKLKGGFVYVFLYTKDVRSFLEMIKYEFKKGKLEILKVEFTQEYDPKMKWENKEDNNKYKRLCEEVKATLKPIFDDFYAYK